MPVSCTKDRLQFHHTQFVIRKTDCSFIIPSLLYEGQTLVSLYPICYTKYRLQFHYTQFGIPKTDCSSLYIPSLLYKRQAAINYTQFFIRKAGCSFIIPSLLYERQASVSCMFFFCYERQAAFMQYAKTVHTCCAKTDRAADTGKVSSIFHFFEYPV